MIGAFLLRLLGVLLLATAFVVATSRAPDRSVESLVERWAPPPSDFIEVRGQVVHIRDEGPRDDPNPIVLLHGTSSSLHTWEGWAQALKSRRRVVRFDLPTFGLTGPYTGAYTPDDYSGDAAARFVLDLMDTLALKQVVLGGNSLGGEIAWRVASLAPQRVSKLLLVDAGGYDVKPESVPVGFVAAWMPVLGRLTEWLTSRALVESSLRNVYGDPDKVTPLQVDRYFELLLREGNRHALVERLRHMHPGADVERLRKLPMPTLILWGGRDRLTVLEAARRFDADIPDSELVVFDKLGHVPQEEDPAQSVQPVLRFLGPSP